MKTLRQFRFTAVAGALALLAAASVPVRAQAADPDDVRRAVARISVMDGQVSVRRGDAGEWVAGVVNAPLLAEDRIATGPGARAEVQFDAANALRIGPNAEVRLGLLEYGQYRIEVAHGAVTYRILRPSTADVEVNTPSVAVKPSQQGAYKITVNDAGETQVVARSGNVEVFTPTGSTWVNYGQSMLARGSGAGAEFQMLTAAATDEFDRWNQERDRVVLASKSYTYVPEGVYGAEDLDRYGNWVNDSEYGWCWTPAVAAGWSPYGAGRWAWEDWYGWTWVSYDPWGWAPYHYGRWFHRDRVGWAWYPGVMNRRHYWSPALVAFIGWGGGGIGFSLGNVGWVPLAPYETFHPWWGRRYYGRPDYIRNVNIVNVNVTNIYRNSRAQNGIHGVRGDDFGAGRFNDIGRYQGHELRDVRAAHGGIPVAPGQAHLNYSDRQNGFSPRADRDTKFFSRGQQQRPAVERIGFAQQQRAFEQAGMPVRGGQARDGGRGLGQGNAPAQASPGNPGGPGRRTGDNNGREVTPRGAAPAARNADEPGRQQGNGGWTRFGGGAREQTQGGNAPAAQPGAQPSRQTEIRGGGTRFGANGAEQNPAGNAPAAQPGAQPSRQNENRGGWTRFGNNGGDQPQGGNAPAARPAPQPTRQNEDRGGGARPGNNGGDQNPGGNAPAARPAPQPTRQNEDRGGWTRFGTPDRPQQDGRQTTRPQEARPAQPSQAAPERQAPPRADQGWSRFGSPEAYREQPRRESTPQAQPQPQRSEPQRSEPRQQQRIEQRQQQPQFSQPRERSQAPAYSAPRESAPAPARAPRAEGGGGGGQRQSGGGGGSAPRSNDGNSGGPRGGGPRGR